MNSRLFSHRGFGYLPDSDRYLTKPPEVCFGFAIIGCGFMGQEHIRNALLEGRGQIVGIYDPSDRSAEFARRIVTDAGRTAPRRYTDLAQINDDAAVDAVFICSPNYTHLSVLQQIVGGDKAIFLEKPIATTVADAFLVGKLLQQHTAPTRVGLQYRYKAIYAEAIAEVQQRNIVGAVKSVSMVEHRFPFLDKVGQWNKFNRFTGGTLVEKCCHYFDLLNLFARARPQRIFAMGNQAVNFADFSYAGESADGLDQAQVTIAYENGVLGSFGLSMFVPGAREELTICGDAGRLFACESARLGERSANRLEIWRGEHGPSRISEPAYAAQIEAAGHHGSTFFEHVAFVEDLLRGEGGGPDIDAAIWSVVVGAAAQESIATAQPVDVEQFVARSRAVG